MQRPCSSASSWFASLLVAAVLGFAVPAAWAQGGESPVPEHRVKAAFLYKFLGFVEWPPRAFEDEHSPLMIGVLGADLLADALAAMVAERRLGTHPIVSRKLQPGDSAEGLHMVFVGRSHSDQVGRLLESARGRPLLIVTESEDAFALGSDINFVIVDDKIRFDVALAPSESGHVKISSRLLAVARRVIPSP